MARVDLVDSNDPGSLSSISRRERGGRLIDQPLVDPSGPIDLARQFLAKSMEQERRVSNFRIFPAGNPIRVGESNGRFAVSALVGQERVMGILVDLEGRWRRIARNVLTADEGDEARA
jgi:hypothetical protein